MWDSVFRFQTRLKLIEDSVFISIGDDWKRLIAITIVKTIDYDCKRLITIGHDYENDWLRLWNTFNHVKSACIFLTMLLNWFKYVNSMFRQYFHRKINLKLPEKGQKIKVTKFFDTFTTRSRYSFSFLKVCFFLFRIWHCCMRVLEISSSISSQELGTFKTHL